VPQTCVSVTLGNQQLNVSTRDYHGYSEKLQRTNLHTYTQGRLQAEVITEPEWIPAEVKDFCRSQIQSRNFEQKPDPEQE